MSDARFVKWLCGNADAVRFIEDIHRIVELWDDLIDRDREPSPDEINSGFAAALIGLPRNPFYMRHFGALSPILESAIDHWHIANDLERGGTSDGLHTSFILRCGIFALTVQAAKIVGGAEWARTVGNEIYQAGTDTFSEYLAEHGAK